MARTGVLPRPPYPVISWCVLIAYTVIFAEALWMLTFLHEDVRRANHAQSVTCQMCVIYAVESVFALGPGWCAMEGWTCKNVLVHHGPYILAVCLGVLLGLYDRWWLVAWITCFTACNEGLLIVIALGAPEWVAKLRRIYGFTVILLLLLAECHSYLRAMSDYYAAGIFGDAFVAAVATQMVLGAMYYHYLLLGMYIRRWKKQGAL